MKLVGQVLFNDVQVYPDEELRFLVPVTLQLTREEFNALMRQTPLNGVIAVTVEDAP
jgi:hypothetical protein